MHLFLYGMGRNTHARAHTHTHTHTQTHTNNEVGTPPHTQPLPRISLLAPSSLLPLPLHLRFERVLPLFLQISLCRKSFNIEEWTLNKEKKVVGMFVCVCVCVFIVGRLQIVECPEADKGAALGFIRNATLPPLGIVVCGGGMWCVEVRCVGLWRVGVWVLGLWCVVV